MMHPPLLNKQTGGALWLLLLTLLMLGGKFLLTEYPSHRLSRQAKLQITLNKAKEALIAYAVSETRRPGRLPCPDMIGNGTSPLLSGDDCPGYNGWLPWKTLDLSDSADDHGSPLKYSLSKEFGGNRKQPPINGETPGGLRAESAEGVTGDIVAIIIAIRGEPDPGNIDGDQLFLFGQTAESNNNDVLAIITRNELMAGVEKRIAGEVRFCLAEYARVNGRYPWPAPLSTRTFRGNPGSLFGALPESQVSSTLEVKIAAAANELGQIRQGIAETTSEAGQVEALKTAATRLTELAAMRLNPWAQVAASLALETKSQAVELAAQSQAIERVTSKEQLNTAEKLNLGTSASQIRMNSQQLATTLADLGLDPFIPHLSRVALNIGAEADRLSSSTLSPATYLPMLDHLSSLQTLLAASHTGNEAISQALGAVNQNAQLAHQRYMLARALPEERSLQQHARDSAETLINELSALKTTILRERVNIHPRELSAARLSLEFAIGLSPTNSADLVLSKLAGLKALTESVSSGSEQINSAKRDAILGQDELIAQITRQPGSSLALKITESTLQATRRLEESILHNAENVALESLRRANNNYLDAERIFSAATTQSQQEMLTYTKTLGQRTADLKVWSELIHAQASDIAQWSEIIQSIDASISRKGEALPDGSLAALQTHLKTPSDGSRALAQTAVMQTLRGLDQLLTHLESFSTTSADGAPIEWASQYCAMLSPENTDHWWSANEWKHGILYQIADPIPGKGVPLTVNGQGNYPLVVISSGSEAWRESGPCRWERQSLLQRKSGDRATSAFLEDRNADSSRDGEAYAPIKQFVSQPITQKARNDIQERSNGECSSTAFMPDTSAFPITVFNDRLAF